MEVRNCRSCGRMFNYIGESKVCPACRQAAEEDYERTRDFIRDNPGASINEVAEECNVTMNQIQNWVRQERLEFSKSSGVIFHCEKCGEPIRGGRFCKNCKDEMSNNFGSVIEKPKVAPEPPKKKAGHDNKMRFLKK